MAVPEFTYADLLAVDSAIKSGTNSVRFADREITYSSMDELVKARSIIADYLNSATGTQPRRQIRMFTDKGW